MFTIILGLSVVYAMLGLGITSFYKIRPKVYVKTYMTLVAMWFFIFWIITLGVYLVYTGFTSLT